MLPPTQKSLGLGIDDGRRGVVENLSFEAGCGKVMIMPSHLIVMVSGGTSARIL